jgi:hypothetical protein
VLALSACDDRGVRITTTRTSNGDSKGVLKVIDALQCPESLGSLTRKGSAQADGTVCTYTGPRGAEVSLHLVKLGEEPVDAVLAPFERRLTADMPGTVAQIGQADAEAARAEAEVERANAEAARAEARAEAEGQAISAATRRDSAHVSGPGLRVDADGDRARVSLPGLQVDADGDKANVRIGGFTIRAKGDQAEITSQGGASPDDQAVSVQARNNAAEIRTRAPGEAVRRTYLLTDNLPSEAGWRLVGYEARGPRGGPIVVATVRGRERNSDGVFEDAKALVTLNVGQ